MIRWLLFIFKKSIMKILSLLTIAFVFSLTGYGQHSLEKLWESDTAFKVPESVLYDGKNKVLYVANIDGQPDGKDGKGSIGKLGLDGKIIEVEWVTGLNSPKGMALVKNMLWVSDLDRVVVIDIDKGEIVKQISIEGSKFLNDVTADPSGNIYVSDSRDKKIYLIKKDVPSLYMEGLAGPNGLLYHQGKLLVLDNGTMNEVKADKTLHKIAEGMAGGTDGIEHVAKKEYLVSCWSGTIYYVYPDGKKEELLNTTENKINSADIGYDAKNRIVYVPTFWKNNVVAYLLK